MTYPSLRRIAPGELRAHAALAHWPRHDAALTKALAYAPLPRHAAVIAVAAYAHGFCWRGHVDLLEWLSTTAPELASLACIAGDRIEQAKSLFEAADNPLDMPFPELAYDVLRIEPLSEQADDVPAQCLLSILTPQGRVWLSDFPDIAAPAVSDVADAMRTLPLALAWHLGSSNASRRLVGSLRCGDVLLIGAEAFELTSAGIAIGRFSINEHGEITVQAANLKEPKETNKPMPAGAGIASSVSAADTVSTASVASAIAASLGDIPLRLDFVLQRRLMTVAELDALYSGQVLQLDPQAEKQVEITVNGMRLATGELVELNGRLGVELHDIAGGKTLAGSRRV